MPDPSDLYSRCCLPSAGSGSDDSRLDPLQTPHLANHLTRPIPAQYFIQSIRSLGIARPHFLSSTLPARGDYCRVPKKSGANAFSKNQELIRRKPLTETPRRGEKFSPGTPTPSSASATHSDDSTATPPNPVRQNAGQILALAGFKRVLYTIKYQ